MCDKIGYEVLSYPLLGGECDVSAAGVVPDGDVAEVVAFEAVFVGWEVQLYHLGLKNLRVRNLMCNFTQNYMNSLFCASNEIKVLRYGQERC